MLKVKILKSQIIYKLKDSLRELVQLCFPYKRMASVDTNILCKEGADLILRKKNHSDSTKKFSETDINML